MSKLIYPQDKKRFSSFKLRIFSLSREKYLVIALVIFIVCVVLALYTLPNKLPIEIDQIAMHPNAQQIVVHPSTKTAMPSPTPLPTVAISGSITPLGDLQLYNAGYLHDVSRVRYYDAGKFKSGHYSGYTRVVAVSQRYENENVLCDGEFFATKDYKKYIVDGEPITNDANTQSIYNTDKVPLSDALGSDFPESISLPHGFSLQQGGLYFPQTAIAGSDCSMPTDLPSYSKIAENKYLTYFALPNDYFSRPTVLYSGTKDYRSGATGVIVVDKTGVVYRYDLVNPSISEYPSSINMLQSDIKTSAPLYHTYGRQIRFTTKNISDSDLTQIGFLKNGEKVYTLKDPQNPLYQKLFSQQIQELIRENTNAQAPSDYIKSIPQTESDFAAKNPVIFIKDPWNRYIALPQSDFIFQLGGAKPVLYFYPQNDTKVSISFQKPMQLFSTIPSYNTGWLILAHPNGMVSDLHSTLCNSLDTNEFGLEYAKDACAKNSYPYLYWSGKPQNENFPIPAEGWNVAKDNLVPFLHQALGKIGLTPKEQNDMISYWQVKMSQTDAPYYRISFLQSDELNAFVPMNISPKPDTYIRVFMDWFPLYQKPTENLSPQTLIPVKRKGFTVVEWGGLKY